VGGDFYDLVTVSGGSVAIIGDVVGKGAEAAALTGLARHTLGATIEATGDIELAFTVLNRRLCERGSSYGGLCTLAVVRLGEDGTASAYSAGHPLPLLRRGGEVSELGTSSPLLGYLREVKPECTEVRIEPGDQIVLYTDGVLDAVGPDDRFGEERLFAAVRGLGDAAAAQAAPALMRELDQFLHGEQSDDIAILTLTRV
jgi:serine phosphatase RsbU (regulator of sigma subunit)